MKNAKKLLWTTLLLTASSFVMKTVGVWFNTYLTARIQTAGIGLWSLVLSVYLMAKTLAGAGMGLVTTRLVIDEPEGVDANLKNLYRTALIPSVTAMTVLYLAAPYLAWHMIGDSQSLWALRVLSFSLPFIGMSTVTGGYSTAKRKMARYALIQMCEQAVHIGVSIWALGLVSSHDRGQATLAAALGITAGEIFSFVCGLLCVLYDRRHQRCGKQTGHFWKKIGAIALPDGAGSVFRSLLSTVQNLLIPKGMKQHGASDTQALEAYGAVHGLALPVLLYPSSILGVLSGLLVPEIAQSKAENKIGHVHYILYRVLHLAGIFSVAVCGAMLGFGKELSLAVYGNTDAAAYITMLAPLIPIMYMDMTSDGLLKGLGLQKHIMTINVLDSIASVVLIYFLVPAMGIYGYVVMIYVTEILNFLLSFSCLIRHSRFPLSRLSRLWLVLVLMGCAILVSRALCPWLPTGSAAGECAVMIAVSTGFFLLLCLATGVLSREDLSWFKKTVQ